VGRRTGVLTGYTTVGRRYSIGEQEAGSTARSQPSRLGIAISFAVVVRRPSRVALVDSELGPSVGDVVIAQHSRWPQRCADVVGRRTGILTGYTTVGRRYSIGEQEAGSTARSHRTRLWIAIGLAVVVRRPGGVALVDGELRA